MQPHNVLAVPDVHLRGAYLGHAVGVLIKFESGQGLFLAVDQERALPAKGQRVPAQRHAAHAGPRK